MLFRSVVILAALSGMSNQEIVVSDLITTMDRSVERQSKLEMKMNEVEKGLKREVIDLRSQLGKKVGEANKYLEAVRFICQTMKVLSVILKQKWKVE